MTRNCGRCGQDKPTSEFHLRRKYGWQAWCKECRRAYDREYWRRTRVSRINMRKVHRRNLLDWYRSLKAAPCADCGGMFHHAAMQWDHLPGAPKRRELSNMVRQGFRRTAILDEISKCQLVCANCHAVRTFERASGRSSAW
jgi:hypothetical protein